MYVVTFYSFRGGVGRSMALVNVGVELAKTGRRVLLVDFDLEAPSLDTFNLPGRRPEQPQPKGVVDFVLRYLEDGRAPDFSEYYYESPGVGQQGGQLWIMPAGRQDDLYGDNFKSIIWQELYEKHDGYLLFEDLKQQWKRTLLPDYVLIDSRTGHTDISGICTRQLPDAVTMLFFPSDSNLRGLKTMVEEIRGEATSPRAKQIQLHFVISNLPDLDDEEQILASEMQIFQEALGYRRLAGTIHHYDSLTLLKQAVFTSERPKSRLAQEYRDLTLNIVRDNVEDRDAAIDFLEGLARRSSRLRRDQTLPTLEERLQKIIEKHPTDSEVLKKTAHVRLRQGRTDEAWTLLNQAVSLAPDDPEGSKERAVLAFQLRHNDIAERDVRRFLSSAGTTYLDVLEIVRMLILHKSALVELLPTSSALRSLDPAMRYEAAWELFTQREQLPVAEAILRELLIDTRLPSHLRGQVHTALALALIGQQKFSAALETIGDLGPRREHTYTDMPEAFNYTMAQWGHTGVLDRDLMRQVVNAAETGPPPSLPNIHQCLAIAYWVLGDMERANRELNRARQLVMANPRPEFSAWHYLRRQPQAFLRDLDALERMIAGEDVRPAVLAQEVMEGAR
jgi:cellulose biosynthesis protein BcsQ